MATVESLPGLNATKEQTPDIVISAQTETLSACHSPGEWKAAVRKHPGVLPAKSSPGDGLKSFCASAGSGPARSGPTCQG